MSEIIRYNSADKDIAAVKCYVKESLNGSPLYRDKDLAKLIPKEEAIDLFNKGLIIVEYGESGGLMNAKPIFIVDGELDGIELDEEAGYGVIFFFANENIGSSSKQEVYINVGDDGPSGCLYYDQELTNKVPFTAAVYMVESGNAIVKVYVNNGLIAAFKPTLVTRGNTDDEYNYETVVPH